MQICDVMKRLTIKKPDALHRVAPLLNQIIVVSGLGWWSIGLVHLKLGLGPSFILNIKLTLFLDLHVETLDLAPQHWPCHFEAGPPAQLQSSHQITVGMFLDLHVGTLDLSLQHWTCHFEAGPLA